MATGNNNTEASSSSSSNAGSDVTVNVTEYEQPAVQPTAPTTPQEISVCITIRNPVN